MSSPRIDSFFSVLENAPDIHAPGYIKIRRSDQDFQKKRDMAFEEAKNEGFQAGYDDGYKAGSKKGYSDGFTAANTEARDIRQAELVQFRAGLERAAVSVQEGMNRWCELAEAEVEELAVKIAEMVLHAELQMDRSAVTSIVKAAMSEVTHAMEARIRMNPIDSEVMMQYRQEIKSAAPSVRTLEFVDDHAIAGGCVIETEGGLVDARIGSQLEMIRTEVRKAA